MARLRVFRRPRPVREDRFEVELDGRTVPLRVRRHWQARRLTLRVDAASGGAVATIPANLSPDAAIDMLRRKADWLLGRLDSLAPARPFVDGAVLPLRGEEHVVRHVGGARGVVRALDGEIHVPGRPEHLARRLGDWLRAEARRALAERTAAKAAAFGARAGRVAVRDTRSRWGSCSANGNLNFCWRLILAPDFVLDYVVAHEVAHLLHRDHGPDFWAAVARLTDDTALARTWLRRNGDTLLRWG